MGKGAVEMQLNDERMAALCERLAAMPRGERTIEKTRELLDAEFGIEATKGATYTLLNGPFAEHLQRLKARKERIEMLRKAREEVTDIDETLIADDTAAQLSFILNDYVASKGSDLNPADTDNDEEELKRLAILQKLVEQVSTIRKDDRALRAELRSAKKVIEETRQAVEKLKDPKVMSDDELRARVMAEVDLAMGVKPSAPKPSPDPKT